MPPFSIFANFFEKLLPARAASTILKVVRMQRLKNYLHLAPEIKRKRATLELIAIKFAHMSTLRI